MWGINVQFLVLTFDLVNAAKDTSRIWVTKSTGNLTDRYTGVWAMMRAWWWYRWCRIVSVRETRVTSILSHVLIGLSVLFIEQLKLIPRPVLDGLFLYLAITALHTNQLFERIMLLVTEQVIHLLVLSVTVMLWALHRVLWRHNVSYLWSLHNDTIL